MRRGRLLGFLRRFRLFLRFSSSLSPIPIADSNFFALPNPRQSHCGRFIPSRYTCLRFEIAHVLLSAISLRSTRPQRQRGTVSIYAWQSFTYHNIYKKKDLTTPTRAVIASANSRIYYYVYIIRINTIYNNGRRCIKPIDVNAVDILLLL